MEDNQPMNLSTSKSEPPASGSGSSSSKDGESEAPRLSKLGELFILGQPHDTVLYYGDDVAKVQTQEVAEAEDDNFFDVTLNDVKSVYRDLQKRRDDLENAPFKGQQLRALEKETAVLKSLHDHPNTAIRVRFPDRFILQGIFRTSDTIGSIKSWLRDYLSDSSMEFHLFTAPPKKVLQDEVRLVEEGLVAMVVIYFGSEATSDKKILKSDLYSRLSDPNLTLELAKNKLIVRKVEDNEDDSQVQPSTETGPKEHVASTSQEQPVRRPVDKGKVPKWFKMK